MTGPFQEGITDRDGRRQFGAYRHVSRMAVASLVFGVLSVVTPLNWLLGIIPATGVVLGWVALLQIRESSSELTGRGLAMAGLWTSVALWVAGYGWLTFRRVQEVPYGYQRVTYGMLQPDPEVRGERIPPAIYDYQDQKVFVKGYMLPTRQSYRLKAFFLSPAMPNCPRCKPNPSPTEMIQVELQGDLETRYTTHLIGIGGKFHIEPYPRNGVPYRMQADYVK